MLRSSISEHTQKARRDIVKTLPKLLVDFTVRKVPIRKLKFLLIKNMLIAT